MRWLDDLQALPPGSLARRLLWSVLLAAGVTMTAFGSMFLGLMGPIPLKWIPDVRPVVLLGTGLLLGLWASFGGAAHRRLALWGVLGFVVGFHLEEATVHWIGPFPGSITGTRVGLLGTAGSLLALAAVALLHVEVESARLARDLARRGADADGARATADALRRGGSMKVLALLAGVGAMGLLVRAAEAVVGDGGAGGVAALAMGGALLLALAVALLKLAPRGAAG